MLCFVCAGCIQMFPHRVGMAWSHVFTFVVFICTAIDWQIDVLQHNMLHWQA